MSSLSNSPSTGVPSSAPAKTYWRSLSELENSPEFEQYLHREFPDAAADFPKGVSRRRWLQIMGASLALAGAQGCRWEREEVLPFTARPDGRVPGEPNYYATAMEIGGVASSLLVRSSDGRPTKVDGNPQHPQNQGASEVFAQAAILGIYDPDRSQAPVSKPGRSDAQTLTWTEFTGQLEGLLAGYRNDGGAGLRILSEPTSSPTMARLREQFAQTFPQAAWHEYAPLTEENALAGSRLALGGNYRSSYDLTAADIILCLDEDLFGGSPAGLRYSREFAARRAPDEATGTTMNRLYVVESPHTQVGAAADHRLPLRSAQIKPFLLALEDAVYGKLEDTSGLPARTGAVPQGGFLENEEVALFIDALSDDLVAHRGRSVVTVGESQDPQTHAVAHRLNAALGNVGQTVSYLELPALATESYLDSIRTLAEQMDAGQVQTLVILGGNPVYNAPAELNFAAALAKVPNSVHLGLYQDETSQLCSLHAPEAHFLETWGDSRSSEGLYTLIQPLIDPLYSGWSGLQMANYLITGQSVLGPNAVGQEWVQETFRGLGLGDSADAWQSALHEGFVADSGFTAATPQLAELPEITYDETDLLVELPEGKLELVLRPANSVYDGRYANSGWLQELPDYMTKITWDNVAMLSPRTARRLGAKNETLIELKLGDKTVRVPVYLMPGQADDSITVSLGYGRTAAGHVGGSKQYNVAPVGVDLYPFRTSEAMYIVRNVAAAATGSPYELACTQDHFAIDDIGRDGIEDRLPVLVREGTLSEYEHDPEFAQHRVHLPILESPFQDLEYPGPHRWGMAIDLSKCVGCNACVIACQAENNIPVVGREQVKRGREMHWMRIDRYFSGDESRAKVVHQPMLCQQCENAPCESVCPVAATLHTHEGLNDMVYNRCIGTRYCSNNCPYKVRRFNYFNYQKPLNDPANAVVKMAYNPEVTVRSRGVMEKCTFCVQRIQVTKIKAKNERRPILDQEIQTACQQACSSQAIVFGDLNNEQAVVTQKHASPRAYAMLAELNVRPRNLYLARITNPNPKLSPEVLDERHDHHA